MKRSVVQTVLLMNFIAPASHAVTRFVAADGSGDYPDIQSAVFVSAPGDTVLVGPGGHAAGRRHRRELRPPELYDVDAGDLRLAATSPCADAPGCGQIGRFGVGCGVARKWSNPTAVAPAMDPPPPFDYVVGDVLKACCLCPRPGRR